MFNNKTTVTNCEIMAVRTNENWTMQLFTVNHWLFNFNTQQKLTLQCNGFNEEVGLNNGLRIVNFIRKCKIWSGNFKLPYFDKAEMKLIFHSSSNEQVPVLDLKLLETQTLKGTFSQNVNKYRR